MLFWVFLFHSFISIEYTELLLLVEPLLTKHLPELSDNIERLIRTFDRRHVLYGNKEYADLLWKVIWQQHKSLKQN